MLATLYSKEFNEVVQSFCQSYLKKKLFSCNYLNFLIIAKTHLNWKRLLRL